MRSRQGKLTVRLFVLALLAALGFAPVGRLEATSFARLPQTSNMLTSGPPTPTLTPVLPTSTPLPPSSTPTPTPTQFPECGLFWRLVDSPSPSIDNNNVLDGISGLSANDIWAAGHYNSNNTARTLVIRWDGSSWNTVPSPNMGSNNSELHGISALSETDIWAVGSYDIAGYAQTLTMHWDGNQWSIVPSPNAVGLHNVLQGVDFVSADDVWAVGRTLADSGLAGLTLQTLIMHWNGSQWSLMPSPDIGTLGSVSAISANDVWAVGVYYAGGQSHTLTMHWDGLQWNIVPDPGPALGALTSVAAQSANDVWSVGEYTIGGAGHTLTMHWDGSQWNIVPSPDPDPFEYQALYSVSARATNDVWAVGTVALHWNGSAWSEVITSHQHSNEFSGVWARAADDVWAVGQYSVGGPSLTMVQHFSDPCGTPTPSPTMTPTSTGTVNATVTVTAVSTSVSTATSTATSTPVATATACSLEFTDVPPGSTFYDNIRCLACRGLINGYTSGCETGDPCFRPGSRVTRGQLAKIVANSAGFSEPTGAQQFEDVAIGSTFFDYVWRLKDRGYIDGYRCGGPGEPCGGGSLPYFRPNAFVTRGQISKIVANAAGLSQPAGTQQFEDVPPGHIFFDYIWRLTSLGIMSGYPCGGPGETCGPGHLPYFRSVANATRGQASKIVAKTFFPECITPFAP